jgi:hypothetical protein
MEIEMAINPDEALEVATAAILAELLKVYDQVKSEDVEPFARAVAQAARVAVEHVAQNAEVEGTGQGIA